MKKLTTLLLLSIFLISCGKEDLNFNSRDCRKVDYDISFDLELNDKVCFPDGNSITLTNIEHLVCPCNIDCKWEGDIFTTLTTTTNTITEDLQFYAIPTPVNRKVFNNHEITSVSYTYNSISGELPLCDESFDPLKTKLTFTISK